MTVNDPQIPSSALDAPIPVAGLIVDRDPKGLTGAILLHPTEPRWALANSTALWMLECFQAGESFADVISRLQEKFPNVDATLFHRDVETFVQQLHQCNMLANAPLPIPPRTREHANPSLTIYLTEECNLRCKHCAIVEGKMPEPIITTAKIKTMIAEHTERYDNPSVTLLGGEPLLQPDIMEIIRFARARTENLTLGTNGLLVTEEMAAELAALDFRVQISLDGAEPRTHDFIRGKGTFEKSWHAVERIAAHGGAKRQAISTVLTRCGVEDVTKLIDRCDALGIGELRFLALNKDGAATKFWDKIYPEPEALKKVLRYLIFDAPKRENGRTQVKASFPGFVPNTKPNSDHWCPLGRTMIVDSQGLVYTCPAMTIPEVTLGNVADQSLEELLHGDVATRARTVMEARQHQVEDCRVCAWRNFCRGGCTAFMAHQSGSLLSNDGYCDFRRDLYREHVLRQTGMWKPESEQSVKT